MQAGYADPLPLAWSALCRTVWHESITGTHPYIYLIIIGGCPALYSVPVRRWCLVSVEVQRLTVCPPACRRRCIGGLCVCCIVCAGIWQINRNSAVKPCKRFWRFDRINLHGRQKSRCKRLCVANTPPGKIKALHPQQVQGKRKTPAGLGRG